MAVLRRGLQNFLPTDLLPMHPAHVVLRRLDDLVVRVAVHHMPTTANPVLVQLESHLSANIVLDEPSTFSSRNPARQNPSGPAKDGL